MSVKGGIIIPEDISYSIGGDSTTTMANKINHAFSNQRTIVQTIIPGIQDTIAQDVTKKIEDLQQSHTMDMAQVSEDMQTMKTELGDVIDTRVHKTLDKATLEQVSTGVDDSKFVTSLGVRRAIDTVQSQGVTIFTKGSLFYEFVATVETSSFDIPVDRYNKATDFLKLYTSQGNKLIEGRQYAVNGNTINLTFTLKPQELIEYEIGKGSLSYNDLHDLPTIVNSLDSTTPSILDGRQGKVLKDSLDTTTRKVATKVDKADDKASVQDVINGIDNDKFVTSMGVKEAISKIQAQGITIFTKGAMDYEYRATGGESSFVIPNEVFNISKDYLRLGFEGATLVEGRHFTKVDNTINLGFTLSAGDIIDYSVYRTSMSYTDLIDTPPIQNNLTTVSAGGVLDARQGKVLKEMIEGISLTWDSITGKPNSMPANGGNSATVNGFTVGCNVPSNAVFTDTVYAHPTTAGNKHIPTGGSTGQYLKYSSSGTAVWATPAKADVGLGNVNNWGATTAINSTSTTTYATASAVKQAYDRAEQAFQSASSGKNAIASAITAKGVPASGSDTHATLANKIGQIISYKRYSNVSVPCAIESYNTRIKISLGTVIPECYDSSYSTIVTMRLTMNNTSYVNIANPAVWITLGKSTDIAVFTPVVPTTGNTWTGTGHFMLAPLTTSSLYSDVTLYFSTSNIAFAEGSVRSNTTISCTVDAIIIPR